jgi:membrane protein implicated in regulation of membrane protease activity
VNVDRLLAVLGLALAIIGLGIDLLDPESLPSWLGWGLFGAGTALLLVAVILFFSIRRSRAERNERTDDRVSVTSHGQSGGITAHTVNQRTTEDD